MRDEVSILREFASVGNGINLLVHRSAGDELVTGTLISVSDSGVFICIGDRRSFYRIEDIRSFELLGQDLVKSVKPIFESPPDAHASISSGDSMFVGNTVSVASPLKELFEGEVFLPLDPVRFETSGLEAEYLEELNRLKNIYEYACKVREPDRIVKALPRFVRIAASLRRPDLHELCGVLAHRGGDDDLATRELNQADQARENVHRELAAIAVCQGQWKVVVEELVTSILCHGDGTIATPDLYIALGRALRKDGEARLLGIAQIASRSQAATKKLALDVVAFALRDRSPSAAAAALAGNLVPAQEFCGMAPGIVNPNTAPNKTDSACRPLERKGRVGAIYHDLGYVTDSSTQKTFYFRRPDVQPATFRQELSRGRSGQNVSFVSTGEVTDPAQRYPLAEEVTLIGPIERSAAAFTGDRHVARKDSPYFRAKRAEQQQRFEEAERFFLQEIDQRGERFESAVKDLAWMHNRLQRDAEALRVLEAHEAQLGNRRAVDNMKLTILTRLERFEDAITVAQRLAETGTAQSRVMLHKQIAYFLFRVGKYADALKLLERLSKELPTDSIVQQLIERVKIARSSGVKAPEPTTGDDLRELAEWSSGLSDFSRFLLDTCDYELADERSKARGYFDRDDFNALDSYLEKIRGRRPGEKAKVLLTIAKMCREYPDGAGDRELPDYLSRALTFLGEAATGARNQPDTARCYLAEALSIANNRNVPVQIPLVHLLGTYLTVPPAPGAFEDRDGNRNLRSVLQVIEGDATAWRSIQRDFPYYSVMSSLATQVLQRELNNGSYKLPNFLETRSKVDEFRDTEMERLRNERNVLVSLRKADFVGVGNLEDAAEKLTELTQRTRFEIDRKNLRTLGRIVNEAANYWREQDYVERETRFRQFQEGLRTFMHEIEEAPTKLSVESLLPLAQHLDVSITRNFDEYVSRTQPILDLQNVLSDDFYVSDPTGEITVRLELSSKPGGAPVEGVELSAEETGGLHVVETSKSPERLRAGDRRELELRVRPSAEQLHDEAFTLRTVLTCRNRAGEVIEFPPSSIPIRIGRGEAFIEIPNPYQNYSGGRSVDDPAMFKGRDGLLARIRAVVTDGPDGQCFVLYGQKRSGKTSVLRQLRRRIEKPAVAFEVTIGALDVSGEQTNFAQLCLDRIHDRLSEPDCKDIDRSWWPSDDAIGRNSGEVLRRTLGRLKQALKACFGRDARVVLLIDEFTYLYEYIAEGLLAPTFMRMWKSLLEMEFFSAVVVGQDSMPKFKQAFPNEFGVTHDERISYLSESEAMRLAEDPIPFNGRSRYRGHAMERLLELTSGSPFYLQILCDRLVRHLNSERAPFITEADVENVSRQLTSGGDALPIERFDPLITAAGESVAEASRDVYLQLLTSIAQNSARFGARSSDLIVLPQRDVLLADMQDRHVISRDAEGRVSIRVGLFADWLRSHGTTTAA